MVTIKTFADSPSRHSLRSACATYASRSTSLPLTALGYGGLSSRIAEYQRPWVRHDRRGSRLILGNHVHACRESNATGQ